MQHNIHKFHFFVLVFLLLFSLDANSQKVIESKVPNAVVQVFKKEFAQSKVIRWEKREWKPKWHYEAIFDFNGLRTRARYLEDGTPVWISTYYPSSKIPSALALPTLSSFPGFKLEWALQTKNFLTKTDRCWLKLSKPGHLLKVLVNTNDGTVVESDPNAMLEAPSDKEDFSQ